MVPSGGAACRPRTTRSLFIAQPMRTPLSQRRPSWLATAPKTSGSSRPNHRAGKWTSVCLRARWLRTLLLGRRPAAVVATAGTTATTAFDPIVEVCEIAGRYGAFVHVDAAMAGSAMLLPECRGLFDGIEAADSMSWNPHKWLGSVLETSLFYVRQPELLVSVMSTNPSFLRSSLDGTVVQYRDWGLPLGRRFRALKLWALLRLEGAEAIRSRMRRDLANAQRFAALVQLRAWLERPHARQSCKLCVSCTRRRDCLARRSISTPCLGARPSTASGLAHVTPAQLEGRWMVRVSMGAEPTEWSDVEALWELMQEKAALA